VTERGKTAGSTSNLTATLSTGARRPSKTAENYLPYCSGGGSRERDDPLSTRSRSTTEGETKGGGGPPENGECNSNGTNQECSFNGDLNRGVRTIRTNRPKKHEDVVYKNPTTICLHDVGEVPLKNRGGFKKGAQGG